jgi:hypothetical protein
VTITREHVTRSRADPGLFELLLDDGRPRSCFPGLLPCFCRSAGNSCPTTSHTSA